MSFKLTVLIFVFGGLVLNVFGQQETDLKLKEDDIQKSIYQLGITPTAIFSKYPGIQLSHRLNIYKSVYFGIESAYLFSIADLNFKRANGFRIRPSLQLRAFNNEKINGYLGIFYNYRHTRSYREVEIFRAGGNFIQIIDGHLDSKLRGWGFHFEFDFNESLPNFAFSLGIGSGKITNVYSEPELRIWRWFGTNVNEGRNREFFIVFYALHYRFPVF